MCHACGCGGDVLALIAAGTGLKCAGADFSRVLAVAEELAADTGCSTVPANFKALPTANENSSAVFELVLDLAPLQQQPDLCDYLRRRGLFELCLRDGWGGLPGSPRDQGRLIENIVAALGPDAWRAAGLGGTDLDFPEHRIVIPYRTPEGDVDTISRRQCGQAGSRYVSPRGHSPKWPFGIDVAVETARPDSAIAFAEGAASALAVRYFCHAEQRPWAVVGVPSTSSWRAEWAYLGAGRPSILLLDADGAGHALAKRMMAELRKAGSADIMTCLPPRGCKDWDQLLSLAVP